jgi:hypothetical protein
MIPHERSLVKRLEGKPFVILGVNGDGDLADLQKRLKESQVTWRSFKHKQGNKNIAADWIVTAWPTLVLIDHRGTIRKRWEGSPGAEELDAAIDKLVAEALKK